MILTHCGTTYECATAVKCEADNYIKLYDENGFEIVSFYNISDFTDYELSGGSFVAPCDCAKPIILSTYSIGGRTIAPGDWVLTEEEKYTYTIESNLISANTATCNIFLLFANGTDLEYEATQESGKVVLYTASQPENNIVIESIQISKA